MLSFLPGALLLVKRETWLTEGLHAGGNASKFFIANCNKLLDSGNEMRQDCETAGVRWSLGEPERHIARSVLRAEGSIPSFSKVSVGCYRVIWRLIWGRPTPWLPSVAAG